MRCPLAEYDGEADKELVAEERKQRYADGHRIIAERRQILIGASRTPSSRPCAPEFFVSPDES
jgi:hypothetical protein